MLFESVHDSVGHTPLVRLRMPGPPGTEVYAKLEMMNPFGMKDRVAHNIIDTARRTGVLADGAPIVESSSGTMALGVALAGRSLGHPVHIVTDPRVDRITLAKLRALGCAVHIVPAMTSHGWQSARLEALERLMADLPGAFWPQQYSNPDNPGAYRQLAGELLTDLGPFDILVGSVGSGGSLCGSSRALRHTLPGLRVVGVDCVGSALFGQPDVPQRLQSGLGNSLLPRNLDRRLIDEVHWLNDHEAFAATRALAAEQQIFAGNTAGSVYRVLGDLAARSAPGSRIVGIFPDRGDRYTDSVYSEEFWAERRLADMERAEDTRQVPYGTVVHTWSRASTETAPRDPQHLLFVESNTTGTGMLALRTTRRLGLHPVLVTSMPGRYAGLAETGAEILACDTNSETALRHAIQGRFRREEIAGITTTSDFYVATAAVLCDWLCLPGNPVAAVRACRDKSALRRLLRDAGVDRPRFTAVTTAAEVPAAVAHAGLPCVVKPVDDSGSNGVRLCRTVAEAEAAAADVLAVRVNVRGLPTAGAVLVEEYLTGPEFSVELFGLPGGTRCVGITAKQVTGTPHFVEHRHVFPAGLDPATARQVEDAARTAVAAAGIVLGPTHTEVRLTADGPVVIEINPRLAGGMIPELVRLTTGTDLLEEQVRLACGLPPLPERTPQGQAGIAFLLAPAAGVLGAVEGADTAGEQPGVEQVKVTAAPGAEVRPARNAYDRLGHVIALRDSTAEVDKTLDAALGQIQFVIDGRTYPAAPQESPTDERPAP